LKKGEMVIEAIFSYRIRSNFLTPAKGFVDFGNDNLELKVG